MSEYILSDLPRYVKTKNRSELNNSPVAEGHALLFSEDGTNLVAKLPDGSFSQVGSSGSGIDTSDATASAPDILSGKTAYVNGEKITGNIANVSASQDGNVVTVPKGYVAAAQNLTVGTAKAAQSYTPGTSDQIIPSGQYLTGDQTIAGDANLLAGNIKEGVSIFNVAGSLAASASCDFYKCASVDTEAKTWTGYKAVLTDGVYSFEATATAGLSYLGGYTPVVSNIYTADALVQVLNLIRGEIAIPQDGLIFYHSLTSEVAPEIGTLTEEIGEVSFDTIDGKACGYFNGSSGLNCVLNTDQVTGAETIICKFRIPSTPDNARYIFELSNDTATGGTALRTFSSGQNSIMLMATGGMIQELSMDSWHSSIVIRDYTNSNLKWYFDGTLVQDVSNSGTRSSNGIYIGKSHFPISADNPFIGYIREVAVYNRILTSSEITSIASA